MNKAGYIAATTVVLTVLGAIVGLVWDVVAQEAGWWGAWALFGLILGPFVGMAVAERRA
jgi:hypothetical protein